MKARRWVKPFTLLPRKQQSCVGKKVEAPSHLFIDSKGDPKIIPSHEKDTHRRDATCYMSTLIEVNSMNLTNYGKVARLVLRRRRRQANWKD